VTTQTTIKAEHVEVFREAGRFAGWPANYGMWHWGDEVVVVFTVGHMKVADGLFHLRDRDKPFVTMQSRSTDGGRSWTTGPFPAERLGQWPLSADEHTRPELRLKTAFANGEASLPEPHPGGLDFEADDFAMMMARSGPMDEPDGVSFFFTTHDRAKSWQGPFALPDFGQTGLAARTAVVPMSKGDALVLLSSTKADGSEGQSFCGRTRDGGASFEFVSYVGPRFEGREGWTIMPSGLRWP